ncbi:MAG: hypothetical protein HYZ83_04940 [Candidatus Omnitrophica bacterium]|nr:hypothetical protein [Candidatus Omnitrophota bacterium]
MKMMTYLFIFLTGFALSAYPELSRKTTADMYWESYMTHMRRQTSAAEIRADSYREMYEVCDKHHECTNVTAGEESKPEEIDKGNRRTETESMRPVIYSPVWL